MCFGRACNGIWDKKSWNRSGASGSQKNRPYGGMLGEIAALFEELYSTVQSSRFIHTEDTHMLTCMDSLVNGLTTSYTSTYANALREEWKNEGEMLHKCFLRMLSFKFGNYLRCDLLSARITWTCLLILYCFLFFPILP